MDNTAQIGNRQSVIYSLASILVSILTLTPALTNQQNLYCPKACTCDEHNLEIVCNESIRANGLPHTLNPITKRIFINNGQMTQLTGSDYLERLEILDLAFNRLSSIDFAHISSNRDLVSLNLSHNNISSIEDNPNANREADSSSYNNDRSTKISLIRLDLSYNNLNHLKNDTFLRFHKLQVLDLSYNRISSLEHRSLDGLFKLEILNLRSNQLIQVPASQLRGTVSPTYFSFPFYSRPTRMMKRLDLGFNNIKVIDPEAFEPLDALLTLKLDSCSIETIHEQAFKGLGSLVFLDLDRNSLKEVPSASFEPLTMLKYLKISANNLTHITTNSFSHLSSLEELQMNFGSFSRINYGSFSGLHYLSKIEITNNPGLSIIEKGTFNNLPKLDYLNLSSNSLSSLSNDGFSQKNPMSIIDLRSNNLHCDCDLKWLSKWLINFNDTITNNHINPVSTNIYQEHQFKSNAIQTPPLDVATINDLINLNCSGPPASAGKLIRELPQNNLECLEPESEINVHIGFGLLFLILSILSLISLINYCHYQSNLLKMLKKNIFHRQYRDTMSPNYQNQIIDMDM